ITHFITNTFMLLTIGSVAVRLYGPMILFAALFANSLCAYTQYYFGSHDLESTGGLSFGAFFLLGMISSDFMKKMPKGLGLSIFLYGIGAVLFLDVYSKTSATTGHFTGLILGPCAYFLYTVSRKLTIWYGPKEG
ncbi:MAG: hypothetical protein ACRDBI_13335, partial [Shewanella sp.]